MPQVALVGCAHIHVPGFIDRIKKNSAIGVKSVWDHDAERAQRRADELGAQVVADVSDIWNDSEIEAAVICSETNRHEPLVLAGAEAKKHLFVEKPLGIGAADAFRMARAIDEAGVLFHTGYFMRGNPIHLFIRDHLQKGTFGKLTRIRHVNCHSGSLGGWFDTEWRWMADPIQAGVGAFGDLGTHSLDILLWLMDTVGAEVTQATAMIDVATGRYGDCDEYGEGLMRFSNGAVATLAAGWVDVANPVWLMVSGTEGHAHIADGQLYIKSNHIEGSNGQTAVTDLPTPQTSGFDLFLQALTGEANAPLVTAQEAALRSAVMEALYRGNETHTWVTPERVV
jgi:predicted dehydrogenase